MTQPPLTFQLTVEEVNTILEALGKQPYVTVYQLIQKLHEQAQGQLNDSAQRADVPAKP